MVTFEPQPLPRTLALVEETLLALSTADAALGRLDGVARLLQNPELISRPYAAREAVASSRIEGTHATLADVYKVEAGRAARGLEEVQLIDAYGRALSQGLSDVRQGGLSLQLVARVHEHLMGLQTPSSPSSPWRDVPVWVGSPTRGLEAATFVPPSPEGIAIHLEQWLQWYRTPPRLPLLVRVGLLHYQFLTIHPFLDGNGRVGRILIQLLLEDAGALSWPLLYVSAYFAEHRREYYDRLQAVRERGEVQQWLQFFLTAVAAQASDGVERATRLLALREHYRTDLAGSRSRAPEVVDLLFVNPVVTAKQVQRQLKMSNQGALNLVRSLERRGWLREAGVFGRGGTKYWYAPEVLGLFDAESEQQLGDE